MHDIEAIKRKYDGYPNVQRFISVQAEGGNYQLMRKLERMSVREVCNHLQTSIEEIEQMAGVILHGMDRVAQGLSPKE